MNNLKNVFAILLFFLISFSTSRAQSGILNGKVTDANNGEPLIGVNIIIPELESTGTAADQNGYFELKLPVGSYSLKASLIGYTPVIKTDIIIKTGVNKTVNIKLSSTAVELEEVTVNGDYFDKSINENNLSTVILGAEEVRRSPGSDQDFQKDSSGNGWCFIFD